MVSPRARREQVRFLGQRGVSQRRACGLLGVPRSTLVYRLRQPEKDARPIDAMQRLSSQYPLRLSPHPHLPATRGTDDEHQPGAALVAPSWPHLAAQTAASPAAGRGLCRRARRITSGPTTSCSIRAPLASSSNASRWSTNSRTNAWPPTSPEAFGVGGGRNLHRYGGRNLHTPGWRLREQSGSRPCTGGSSACCYVTIWSGA